MSDVSALHARRAQHRRQGLCGSCTNEAAPGHTLCEEHLRYHRQFKRELRAERRAAGICYACGARPARKNGTCSRCRRLQRKGRARHAAKRRARQERQRVWEQNFRDRRGAAGLCTRGCGRPSRPGRTLCAECHAELVEANAERRLERREQGLCRCGRNPLPGRSCCRACTLRARRATARRRQQRSAAGLCFLCAEPRGPIGDLCVKHREMQLEAQKRVYRRTAAFRRAQKGGG